MTDKPSDNSISLKFGFIAGFLMSALSLVLSVLNLDLDQQSLYGKIGYLIMIATIALGLLEYRNNYQGLIYKKGLKIGTLISLYAGLVSSVYTYIYIKFIDRSLIQMMKDAQLTALEDQGMSDSQIEQSMQMMKMFLVPGFIAIIVFISYVMLGFVFSLVLSAIFQKKPLETDPFDV